MAAAAPGRQAPTRPPVSSTLPISPYRNPIQSMLSPALPNKTRPLTHNPRTEPAQRASNTAPANLNLNNIASNNPFRNRMSTASPSPRSPDPTVQQYPFPAMSRNPFLDPADKPAPAVASNGDGVALADDIFVSLTLCLWRVGVYMHGDALGDVQTTEPVFAAFLCNHCLANLLHFIGMACTSHRT